MPLRRKLVYRKKRVAKRNYRKRAGLRRAGGKHGGMYVVRKMKPLASQSTVIAGAPTITSNSCIAFGTAVAEPYGTNMYSVPFVATFHLNDVVNSTEFGTLFDRYRIAWAKIKVQSALTAGTQTATSLPFFEYVTDSDDDAYLTVNQMREKMGVNVKYITAAKPAISIFVKPKPAAAVYQSAGSTGYAVPRSAPWINMTNDSVPHYAIKGLIRNAYLPAGAANGILTWDVTLGIQLRDVQ